MGYPREMRSRFLSYAFVPVLALAAACGGKIEDLPDGSSPDGAPPPDASKVDVVPPPPKPDASPIACGSKTGEGYVGSDGQCGERDEWTCSDGNVYELACKCPADPSGQTCACRKNGITTKVFAGNVCPACTNVVAAAKQCGFPE